jgi:hypothetical protein
MAKKLMHQNRFLIADEAEVNVVSVDEDMEEHERQNTDL